MEYCLLAVGILLCPGAQQVCGAPGSFRVCLEGGPSSGLCDTMCQHGYRSLTLAAFTLLRILVGCETYLKVSALDTYLLSLCNEVFTGHSHTVTDFNAKPPASLGNWNLLETLRKPAVPS